MSALSTPAPAGIRHSVYIEELHEFLATCGLPYGSPDDILAVTERLQSSETFFADLSSLMRSIVLRERGAIAHAELLEILALAIGGPRMERAPQDFQQPLRQLLVFVTGLLRRPWNQPPAESGAVLPFPSDAATATPTPAEPLATTPAHTEETKPTLVPAPAELTRQEPTSKPALAEALAIIAKSEEPEPPATTTTPAETDAPEPAPFLFPIRNQTRAHSLSPQAVAAALPPAPPAPAVHSAGSTRWIFLAAAAALGLLVLLSIKLRHPASPPVASNSAPPLSAPVDTSQVPTQPASMITGDTPSELAALTKPSADGSPLVTQPPPAQHVRRNTDEEDDTDVAPPTVHNSPGWPPPTSAARPAPAPLTTASSATPTPASTAPSTSSAPAAPAPATNQVPVFVPIERRTPLGLPSANGGPSTQQQAFRDPDGSIVGDPLPVQAVRGRYFRVSSGVMAANLLSDPEPGYPTLARLAHIQGQVILQAVISRDGFVSATRVLSGNRLLRGAAVDAVRRWRYRPYLADGRPVDVDTIITVEFHNSN